MKLFKTALMAIAITFLPFTAHAESQAIIGQPAPDFELMSAAGTTHSLQEFRGKTIVLEWTNHECPYVRKHYDTGNMQALQKEVTDGGAIWLSIVSSGPGKQGYTTPEVAQVLIEDSGASATARLLDADGKVGHLYDARTTPHMFIVDKDGILVYMGAIDNAPSPRHDAVEMADNYIRMALTNIAEGKIVAIPQTKPYGCSVKYKKMQ